MDSQSYHFLHDIRKFCQKNHDYPPDAYNFLVESFNITLDRIKQEVDADQDISAAFLLEGIKRYALEQYGALAFHVLSEWNIHTTMDFGKMVFNLVQIGWFGKSDDDSIKDFDDVFSFEDAFVKPFLPAPQK